MTECGNRLRDSHIPTAPTAVSSSLKTKASHDIVNELLCQDTIGASRSKARPKPCTSPGVSRAVGTKLSPANRMVDDQANDRSEHGDEQAVKIETADPGMPEEAEEPTADNGADNAEQDVEEQTFAATIDQLAADEAGNQPE